MTTSDRPLSGNVLVLGSGSRAFLTVIRSLGRAGLTVDVGMCPEDDIAIKSHYVKICHDIPAYHSSTTRWLDKVKEAISSRSYNLIIPCDDPSLIPLQQHKKELQSLCRLYTLSDRAYQISADKIASSKLATEQGIPVPRSAVVSGPNAVAEVLKSFKLPLILKPVSSFVIGELQRKRAVQRARTENDVKSFFRSVRDQEPTLVQENFIGIGAGVEILAHQGDILVAFQHQRVHEPLEGGGSSYRKSVPVKEELLSAAKKLMKALEYSGVAMVEFKLNIQTGEWVFVEINGRFWGSLPLAVASGVDFPRYLYEMLVEGRTKFPADYRKEIYCRNIKKDMHWMVDNLRADKNDPTLATRPLHKVVGELMNFVLLRERFDTFVLDDPLPGIVELDRITRESIKSVRKKILNRFHDSRMGKRLERTAICNRLGQAKEIIFVCKGNICRSPFAQQYAEKNSTAGIHFSSCGYYPVENRPAPENAQKAAKKFGIDLTDHRSAIATEDMLIRAGLIFVFDAHNREQLTNRFPQHKERIYYIGSLLDEGPACISDPYGSDEESFRYTYQRIATAIETLNAYRRNIP